ncbi:DUF4118 domain-containing protein [bacterium]|jgi:PAS domain S-box-containing protein|nr:DUF4118 domain-containing protein [bacterium]
MTGRFHPVFTYGLSLLAVAFTILARLLLDPVLGDRLPFHILFVGVVFAAWFGGRWPGVVALLVSSMAAVFFILEPRYQLSILMPEYRFGLAMYIGVGLATIAMIDSLRIAWRQAAEKSKLLATLLSRMGDGVIVADADGNLTSINPVAEVLTGWSWTEAKGKPLDQVFRAIHDGTGHSIDIPVQLTLRRGDSVPLGNDMVLISREGMRHDIEATATPLSSQGGIAVVFRDLSEQRRLFGRDNWAAVRRA